MGPPFCWPQTESNQVYATQEPRVCYSNPAPPSPLATPSTDAVSKFLLSWQSRDHWSECLCLYPPDNHQFCLVRVIVWSWKHGGGEPTHRENKKQAILHKGLICTKVLDHGTPWSESSYVIFLGLNFSIHRMKDSKGLISLSPGQCPEPGNLGFLVSSKVAIWIAYQHLLLILYTWFLFYYL